MNKYTKVWIRDPKTKKVNKIMAMTIYVLPLIAGIYDAGNKAYKRSRRKV